MRKPGSFSGAGSGPSSTRFKKGQSGNPKGRPKATSKSGLKLYTSAYDVILDRKLIITKDGKQREATVEEALQHATMQHALKGSRAAQKKVLKMIAERDSYLAQNQRAKQKPLPTLHMHDTDNAFEALLLLGIALPDERWSDPPGKDGQQRLLLEPWAVQLALKRRGLKNPNSEQRQDIFRCTRDAQDLIWPDRFAS